MAMLKLWLVTCLLVVMSAATGCVTSGGGGGGGGDAEGVPADPGTGPVTLATGFGQVTRTGETTGASDEPDCTGWFPAEANVTMTLEDSFTGLAVRVVSDDETVLMISFEGGSFCSADPTPEIVRGNWSPAIYDVFVGTPEEGATADYELQFIEG